MGILSALAAIPTVANLTLKLKDAEAELKRMKDKDVQLEAENAVLKRTVSELNAQVAVLTNRIGALEAGDPTKEMMAALGLNATRSTAGET